MSDDTARRFMNVARKLPAQIPHGAKFHPAILYLLAAPSTTDEVRTEITKRVTAGKQVTVADVRALKEKAQSTPGLFADVKAKADRAVSKMPRPAVDPKPAADRAEAEVNLKTARAAYVAALAAAKRHGQLDTPCRKSKS